MGDATNADGTLLRQGAAALARGVAAGDYSALELCDAAIARIERHDGAINAVVVRDFDRARDQARAADAARRRGERGALLGVPMTVKEAFNVAGLATTWGVKLPQPFRAARDAVTVQRLKSAGAVILGKTNVATRLGDWQSVNAVYGRTVNPHDGRCSAGGSSGGSAAALAAGMVALELGSDIGGSIRVPAHFCGVYGHKPSLGLLPTRGHDFPGYEAAPDPLSVVGPLAHHAADLDLALDVMAGPDEDDAAGYRLALPPPRHDGLAGQRVLVLDRHPLARTGREVGDAMDRVARTLSQGGARVSSTSDRLPDLAELHGVYLGLLIAVTSRGAPDATPISSHEWLQLMDRQFHARARWRDLFREFDAVVCPAYGTPAFPHIEEPDFERRVLVIDGEATPYGQQLAWPAVATLPGLPATAVPVYRTAAGLPAGVQIIGPYLGDRNCIALARALAEPLA